MKNTSLSHRLFYLWIVFVMRVLQVSQAEEPPVEIIFFAR
jgi:hypothetical protein